jgi:uncharacterized protein (TIGR02217 family)
VTHISATLPQCISAGSEGITSSAVDIITNPAGFDVRVQRRAGMRRKFTPTFSLRLQDGTPDTGTLYDLMRFWEICEGPLHSFAYHDRLDHKSCAPRATPSMLDCLIGTGDGATATFQMRKSYTLAATTRYRTILLPKSGTVLISVDGVLKTETTHYTVNYLTGIVTFTGGNIPAAGKLVKAGFWFYCKVRFDSNDLSQTYEGFKTGAMGSIPLIEVLT